MIQEVSGDILLSKAQVICHGVAPNDPHDQGLALALRGNWPAMYKDFKHFCRLEHPTPGSTWHWGGAGGLRITALMTQDSAYGKGERPGRAHTDFVNHALRELAHWLVEEDIKTIALPRLATGVGRLDWDDVKPLIEHHIGPLKTKAFVYSTYHADVAAEEKGV
ncbi:MAG: O-acetyl-ADP-ribose deacetylase (regulator of RNase III) [Myxococcota bacterium]